MGAPFGAASGILQGFAESYARAQHNTLDAQLGQRKQLADAYLGMLQNARPEAQPEIYARLAGIASTPIYKKLDKHLTDISTIFQAPPGYNQPTSPSSMTLQPPGGTTVTPGVGSTAGPGASPNIGPGAFPAPPPTMTPVPGQGTQVPMGGPLPQPPPYNPMFTPEERIQQQSQLAGASAGAQESAKLEAFNAFYQQFRQAHPEMSEQDALTAAMAASGRVPYGMFAMQKETPGDVVPDNNSPTGFSRKVYDFRGNVTRLEPGAEPPAGETRLGEIVPDKGSPTGYSRKVYNRTGDVVRMEQGAAPPSSLVQRYTQRVEHDQNGNLVKVITTSGPAGQGGGGTGPQVIPITDATGNPLHGPLSQAAKTSLEQVYAAQGLIDKVQPDLEAVVQDIGRGGNIWDSVEQRSAWKQYRDLGLDPAEIDPDSVAQMLPNIDPRLAKLMPTIAMLQIVGAQPYLRSTRNFKFVEQIQAHLPNPELDTPQLMLSKLQQLGPNLKNLTNAVYKSEGIGAGLPTPPGGGGAAAPAGGGGGNGAKSYSPNNPFAPKKAATAP